MVFLCKTFKTQVNDEAVVTIENRQSEIDGSDESEINNKSNGGNKDLGKTKVESPTSRVKDENRKQRPKMEKKASMESPTSKLKDKKTAQKPKMEEKAKSSTWRVKDEETKQRPKIERASPTLNLPSEKKNEKGNTDNIQTIDESTNQQVHLKTKEEVLQTTLVLKNPMNCKCDGCTGKLWYKIKGLKGVERLKFENERDLVKIVGTISAEELEELERKCKKKIEIITPPKHYDKTNFGDGTKTKAMHSQEATSKTTGSKDFRDMECREKSTREIKNPSETKEDGNNGCCDSRNRINSKTKRDDSGSDCSDNSNPKTTIKAIGKGVGHDRSKNVVTSNSDIGSGSARTTGTAVVNIIGQTHSPYWTYPRPAYGQDYSSYYSRARQIFSDENPNSCSIM